MKHEFYITEHIDDGKEAIVVVPHSTISFYVGGYMKEDDQGARNMISLMTKCGRTITIACHEETEQEKDAETQGGGFIVKNITLS